MDSNSKLFSRLFLIVLAIKVFDVFKNLLIASVLGVTDNADIYNSLIIIPDSLIVLFGLDTIRGVVNSEFAHHHGKGRETELWNSFGNIFNLLFWIGISLVSIVMIFSPQVIGILLPGFTGQKKDLAVSISYIIFPILMLRVFTGYYHSVFNSVKKFYLPVTAPVIISLLLVISLFFPYFKNEVIYNLSFANLTGNLILLAVLTYGLFRLGAEFRIGKIHIDELTRTVIKGSSSILFLVVCNQIFLFSKNYFASFFGEGSISALHYSGTISSIVISLVFATFFTALISKLSSLFSDGKSDEALHLYMQTMKVLLFAVIPVVAFFLVYGKELLTLLYLRGQFDEEGLKMTMMPFYWDVLSLITFVLYIIPTAYFLALKDYKLLTKIGSAIYLGGTLLNYLLTDSLGFYGISVSNFFTTAAYGSLLLFFSLKSAAGCRNFLQKSLLILSGGTIVFALLHFLKSGFVDNLFPADTISLAIILALNAIIAALLYLIIMSIFKTNLASEFIRKLSSS